MQHPDRKHLPQLDAVRGVAILLVFFYHCLNIAYGKNGLTLSGLWQTTADERHLSFFLVYPLSFGWTGVTLFFVLSGFVIHHSFLQTQKYTVRSFYWRRFWRIYPPYFLALVVVAAVRWRQAPHDPAMLKDFVLHALLIHDFSPRAFTSINPSFWSLAVEMQFYVVYPLVILIRRRIGFNRTFVGVIVVSILMNLVAIKFSNENNAMVFFGNPLVSFAFWMAGAYVAEQFHHDRRAFVCPAFLAWGLIPILMAVSVLKNGAVFTWPLAALLGAIFVERSIWAKYPFPRVGQRYLISLGIFSYSFYLWHQPLLDQFNVHFKLYRIHDSGLHFVSLLCASMIVLYPLTWFLYSTVERLSLRIAKVRI